MGKSPGHDGVTKEFYKHIWDSLKFCFMNFLKQSKIDGHFSISRQTIIKLMAKKGSDKRLIKNW